MILARGVRFGFLGPRGFVGFHEFEVIGGAGETTVPRHSIHMETEGAARLTWPLVFGPLHDALLEDALALAQANLGLVPTIKAWSPWVKLLRFCVYRGASRPQSHPERVSAPPG